MNGFSAWLRQLDFSGLGDVVIIVLASLSCIVIHELCHGLVAYWLGDRTAKNAGRLSLNPLRHVDPMGLLMMAVFRFGWAKAVPVDMRQFQNPKVGMALTAAAGPISNLLLAVLAMLLRSVVLVFYLETQGQMWCELLLQYLEYVAVLSIGLAIFNVIPIPPLDGSKVLFAVLPARIYEKLMRYERYGFLLLVVLLFTGVLDTPLYTVRKWLLDGIANLTWFPFELLAPHIL